jgi:thermolysin
MLKPMAKRTLAAAVVGALALLSAGSRIGAQQFATAVIQPTSEADLRVVGAQLVQMERASRLRLRSSDRDPAFPNRVTERLQQFHQGVPVYGADVVRDMEQGTARTILGTLVANLDLAVQPAIARERAEDAALSMAGAGAQFIRRPELVILPLDSGAKLAYMAVLSVPGDVFRLFVDAQTGAELLRFTEIQTQATVMQGRGVLGDQKKMSVLAQAGTFVADDKLRPPLLTTFDMRDNLNRAISILNGFPVFSSDIASDTGDPWDDAVAVDAHVNIGWTYDYYFKRFGRRGLDGADRRIMTLIHGVSQQTAVIAPIPSTFVINAFWCGGCGPGATGAMYFGDGIPSNFFLISTGQNVTYLAGSLDIAAHELTHGVTDSSSRLIYMNESGALNEAFSDIMGTSVEFFYQTPGGGLGQADYLMGEDSFRAFRPGSISGIRSHADPLIFGDPDHYSIRFLGPEDNGGVHINAGIPNHAFYLAIEGGRNRTSGMTVQGVGAANREQIERAFYRAFVFMLPPSATFSMARTATVQAARDLFGAASAAQASIAQAWTAVGVN